MSGAPTEKAKKYDRQLRLWGDHGQSLLETANICLINANATGCEILKNVILPGVGSFSIIDEHEVQDEDLGNNFFLTMESKGKKRGLEACRLLQELNEDVSGDYIDEKLSTVLKKMPDLFNKFSLVIASSLNKQKLEELCRCLENRSIPLIICQTYGMIGYLQLVLNQHTVIESHPDNSVSDLRLVSPFTELVDYCNSINLNQLNKKEHSHIPWLVIVYKYLQIYQQQNDGNSPSNYKDKLKLKDMIRSGILTNFEGVPEDEENFDEAMKSVNTALTRPYSSKHLPENLITVLNHENTINLNTESCWFWILCNSLKTFIEKYDMLPLQGSIPDMTADSKSYIQLQQMYKRTADQHTTEIYNTALNLQSQHQQPADLITYEETKLFCRNAANLHVITTPGYPINSNNSKYITDQLAGCLDDDFAHDSLYYIIIRAVEEFRAIYNRYPGLYDDQVEADVPLLKSEVNKLISQLGLTGSVREDYIHEICSYGGAEPHFIAAYMGGVIGQEVIKILTRQYLPVNNVYIYNAISQTSTTLTF